VEAIRTGPAGIMTKETQQPGMDLAGWRKKKEKYNQNVSFALGWGNAEGEGENKRLKGF